MDKLNDQYNYQRRALSFHSYLHVATVGRVSNLVDGREQLKHPLDPVVGPRLEHLQRQPRAHRVSRQHKASTLWELFCQGVKDRNLAVDLLLQRKQARRVGDMAARRVSEMRGYFFFFNWIR